MSVNNIKHLKSLLSKSGGQFSTWRMLNIVITGILLATFIFSIFFIYKNINTTLTNAATVLNIKSKITFDTLDIRKYDAAKLVIEKKKKLPTLSKDMRNMFNYGEVKNTTTTKNATEKQ